MSDTNPCPRGGEPVSRAYSVTYCPACAWASSPFQPGDRRLLERVSAGVELAATLGAARRCHETAIAVGAVEHLSVVHGTHGTVEHSWLIVRGRLILDVFCVGRLPLVQLVDPAAVTGHAALYREGPLRANVDPSAVARITSILLENPCDRTS